MNNRYRQISSQKWCNRVSILTKTLITFIDTIVDVELHEVGINKIHRL